VPTGARKRECNKRKHRNRKQLWETEQPAFVKNFDKSKAKLNTDEPRNVQAKSQKTSEGPAVTTKIKDSTQKKGYSVQPTCRTKKVSGKTNKKNEGGTQERAGLGFAAMAVINQFREKTRAVFVSFG